MRESAPKTKKFIAKFYHEFWSKNQRDLHFEISADFHKFWGNDQKNKKAFISKTVRIFTIFEMKPQR